jgi:hypothetical protein
MERFPLLLAKHFRDFTSLVVLWNDTGNSSSSSSPSTSSRVGNVAVLFFRTSGCVMLKLCLKVSNKVVFWWRGPPAAGWKSRFATVVL